MRSEKTADGRPLGPTLDTEAAPDTHPGHEHFQPIVRRRLQFYGSSGIESDTVDSV